MEIGGDEKSNRTIGRVTREQREKCNQMTALRFQTWGRHQKHLASLRAKRADDFKGGV